MKQNDASQFLRSSWMTERILVVDSTLEDVPYLTQIFNACGYVEPWDPTFHTVVDDELTRLVLQSIATTGADQSFRLQCLWSKMEDKCLGYFHIDHCPPGIRQRSTVWLSMFVMHPSFQRKQFAQEVVTGLAQQLTQCGYAAIWIGVYLKNWPAMRFWIQQGFTKIIKYDGASVISENGHARLILEKRL